ncbi:hypothetical protein B0H16DRAFT_1710915 [Mycena metata]|uniref:Uncharacterized protein n=1 Tax=Mycena metata TaxID=1033252 RepID=A0AAD7NXU0_9AGAR|nr:hypothetical protein B0H16DRAFT_1710915 [Mycena metata]
MIRFDTPPDAGDVHSHAPNPPAYPGPAVLLAHPSLILTLCPVLQQRRPATTPDVRSPVPRLPHRLKRPLLRSHGITHLVTSSRGLLGAACVRFGRVFDVQRGYKGQGDGGYRAAFGAGDGRGEAYGLFCDKKSEEGFITVSYADALTFAKRRLACAKPNPGLRARLWSGSTCGRNKLGIGSDAHTISPAGSRLIHALHLRPRLPYTVFISCTLVITVPAHHPFASSTHVHLGYLRAVGTRSSS